MSDKHYPTIVYWDRSTGEPLVVNPESAYDFLSGLFKNYKYIEDKGVWGYAPNNLEGRKELRYMAVMRKNDTQRHWAPECCPHPPEVKLLLLLTQ